LLFEHLYRKFSARKTPHLNNSTQRSRTSSVEFNLIIGLKFHEIEREVIEMKECRVRIVITGARSVKPCAKVATELVDEGIHGDVGLG